MFSKSEIEEFEDSYEIPLSADVVRFLKTYSAFPFGVSWQVSDRVVEKIFTLDDSDDAGEYEMDYVLSLVFDRITEDGDSHRMPIIPIGALFGGDLLCLDFRQSDVPQIVAWDHEASDVWSPVTHGMYESVQNLEESMKQID